MFTSVNILQPLTGLATQGNATVNVTITGLGVGVYNTPDGWTRTAGMLGGLIGWSNTSTIISSSTEGVVSYTANSSWHSGGLIGYSSNKGFISDCVADVDVTGGRYNGGFVGFIEADIDGVTIQNCASLGDVTAIESHVGGFVGLCGWCSGPSGPTRAVARKTLVGNEPSTMNHA